MDKFVGFNLSKEHNDALIKLAGERQTATGERVDKSVLLREAVAAYLGAQGLRARPVIERTVNNLALAEITCAEAVDALGALVYHARQDTRAAIEAEWAGANDEQ